MFSVISINIFIVKSLLYKMNGMNPSIKTPLLKGHFILSHRCPLNSGSTVYKFCIDQLSPAESTVNPGFGTCS